MVRDALAANNGREVKHTGDGIMASFGSRPRGHPLCCAHSAQCAQTRETDLPVRVRIGAAAGEPIDHGNDIFGATVQLAARLCAQAEPEQIVVSNVIAELCLGKGIAFELLGKVTLKGFEHPVKVHAVDWAQIALA